MTPERRQYMVYRNAYYGMVRRCYDEKNNRYINYGARGIRVCDRWLGNKGFDNTLRKSAFGRPVAFGYKTIIFIGSILMRLNLFD